MSDDWKPGDLALLIGSPPETFLGMKRGAIYTVSSVIMDVGIKSGVLQLGLTFSDFQLREPYTGIVAYHFRKVTPEEADEFDRETIRLLTEQTEEV